jgi:hypothetical protein
MRLSIPHFVKSLLSIEQGVSIKRCVPILVLGLLLCVQHPAKADPGSTKPLNDFAGQIMADGRTGRVGIGTREPSATLDVYQGEVKIGSTGAACTKGLTGALRAIGSKLQFCDGAGWRNVSLDKAE